MRRSFRTFGLAASALFLVSCVSAQGVPSAPSAPSARTTVTPDRMRILTVSEGELHCKGPTGDARLVKCTDLLVIVLRKSDGGCIVQVPYHDLVIHSKKNETTVTWSLLGSSNYKFAQANGIEITNPGNTFTRVGPNGALSKYSWKVPANAPALQTDHIANVVDADRGNALCDPGDPTITNDPS